MDSHRLAPDTTGPHRAATSLIRQLLPLLLVTTTGALGTSLVNVALPPLAEDFSVPLPAAQWVTLAFLLTSTMLLVPVGWLGDRYGRVPVLRIGLGIFAVSSLLGLFAPWLELVVFSRALQGTGVAAMLALPVALVRQRVSGHQVGRAMGLLGSAMATGMALGPALGGALSSAEGGWKNTFLVLAGLSLAAFATTHRLTTDTTTTRQGALDVRGLLGLGMALGCYSIALTLRPGGTAGTLVLLAISGLALSVFVRIELRATRPLVDLRALRAIGVLPQLGMAFAVSVIMMTFIVIPPFFLTQALGLSPTRMGLVMAVGPVVAILCGVPAGWLVDRIGAPRVTVMGLGLLALASLVFVLAPGSWGVAGFLLGAVLLTPGNQLFMAANNTVVMSRAGERRQGQLSGMLNLARNLGFITGTALMSLVFDLTSTMSNAGASTGLRAAFGLGVVFALAALVPGWRQRLPAT
ncbi:MFS transporter [Glutamicibacter sp. MNS18]|uniref:MFS transporter n=1 Tax=Glutamicibacter sp. MNS18 TaxID=2989817 RepID=UPI0022355769|nr:MFS transporter [Glutamicibacter sp. MNS18]MCW4466574.1 MFS transporter [Glutamicibacter sp. MNS18]